LEIVIRGIPSDQEKNVSILVKKLPYDVDLYRKVKSEMEH
jgi:hypothetical protein